MPTTKVGFCFSGEGARGAIQAGIAADLASQGLHPDFTAGVSSGSICAAAYAHLGPEGLVALWSSITSVFSVFGLNWWLPGKSGLMHQKPMAKLVHAALKHAPLCESMVTRLSLASGELDYVSNYKTSREDFAEAVLGSVAITGLVQDRNGWVDAGSRQLAPISLCVDEGCTDIYVILGRPLYLQPWKQPRGLGKLIATSLRALDLTLFEIALRDISQWVRARIPGVNITVYQPTKLFYETTEFKYCKPGVTWGRENYTTYNSAQLRAHFEQHPVRSKVVR